MPSQKKRLPLSVIIPAFNESKTIGIVLDQVRQQVPKSGTEFIVVDDGSADHTGPIARQHGAIVLRHETNRGYGASIKTGLLKSRGEWVLITDADGTYPAKAIPQLLKQSAGSDMVVGARTGSETHVPWARVPAKWFLTHLANYLTETRIPDLNSGLRLFRKELAMDYWPLFPDGFSFTTTLTVASLSNSKVVRYVPINYYKRLAKSTVDPVRDFIGFNRLLLKLTLFFRPLKIFLPASALFLAVAAALFLQNVWQYHRVVDDIKLLLLAVAGIQLFFFGLLAELIVRKGSVARR